MSDENGEKHQAVERFEWDSVTGYVVGGIWLGMWALIVMEFLRDAPILGLVTIGVFAWAGLEGILERVS